MISSDTATDVPTVIHDTAGLCARLESLIRGDAAGRGLLAAGLAPLGLGELAAAAASLAAARRVCILTGYFIPAATLPAAETDGPPGAVALAITLRHLNIPATLVTDAPCLAAVQAAVAASSEPDLPVVLCHSGDELREQLCSDRVSHLVAIERAGPSYDAAAIARRDPAAAADFAATVPQTAWGRCHNMRGQVVDEWTADFSAAFEPAPTGVTTIGLGDGGNELGMGRFAWSELSARLAGLAPAKILCRVPADYAVLAGTSNWAGYALAAATAALAGRPAAFASITTTAQTQLLAGMVAHGPAVDGITGRPETSVDGIALAAFLQPLADIRTALGLPRL